MAKPCRETFRDGSEVAEAIVWLMSDAASYTSATLMDIAGGR